MFYFNYRCIFEYRKELTTILKIEIMTYSIKVTNEELFNNKVVDVDLDFHKGGMHGDVAIEVVGEKDEICYSGEHGSHDYEDDFGFIIISE